MFKYHSSLELQTLADGASSRSLYWGTQFESPMLGAPISITSTVTKTLKSFEQAAGEETRRWGIKAVKDYIAERLPYRIGSFFQQLERAKNLKMELSSDFQSIQNLFFKAAWDANLCSAYSQRCDEAKQADERIANDEAPSIQMHTLDWYKKRTPADVFKNWPSYSD
jgi:hypothetical protein